MKTKSMHDDVLRHYRIATWRLLALHRFAEEGFGSG
jgi:hypothetical protein